MNNGSRDPAEPLQFVKKPLTRGVITDGNQVFEACR
jgi:hypothetical protein